MTGYEKTAVLLGELGSTGDKILSTLNLRTDQIAKLRRAMTSLGTYNPNDSAQVAREVAVLEEFRNFGIMRGIYKEQEKPSFIKTGNSAQDNARKFALENPDAMASIIANWVDE